MKKSLVLAMAMALGVTASAYAANPFSDVPAGHWAYDSIDKLAAAGVIDGMGDGTYQGDKTMTRYEMAQIVAKAMAKGANVDKLAAEFADELDNLGVRVANLEKKADNVKITGQVRLSYAKLHNGNSGNGNTGAGEDTGLRTRIWIAGQVNEDWTYTAMLQNQQWLDGDYAGKGEEDVAFQRAYLDGKVGGLAVRAGRYSKTDITAYNDAGAIYDTRVDGIQVSYGKKLNVTVGYNQMANKTSAVKSNGDKMLFAEAKYNVLKGDVHAGYYSLKNLNKTGLVADDGNVYASASKIPTGVSYKEGKDDAKIWTVGFNQGIAKNLSLSANYLKSDLDKIGAQKMDDDGYVVELGYGKLNRAKVGSYRLIAQYMDLGGGVTVANGWDTTLSGDYQYGYKGFQAIANVTLAKNIVGQVKYMSADSKEVSKDKQETLWSQVTFYF